MKKQLLIYILFNIFLLQGAFSNSYKLKTISSDKSIEKIEFQFRHSKIKLIQKVESIWGCTEVDLKSVILKFNDIDKDYIIIELELEKRNTQEEFEFNLRATSRALKRHILNLKDFKGGQLNYIINSGNKTIEKSEILFVIPDKLPIVKGCDKNLSQEDMKKCFSTEISKHIGRNFDTSILNKLKLKKGKHKILAYFTIDKTGAIVDVIVDNDNEHHQVKLEAYKVIKAIKITAPAINNGEIINLKLGIPIAFEIH